MTRKILKSILTAAMVVLLASLLIITGVMYEYFGNIQKSQLNDELHLAATATEQLGKSYLNRLNSKQHRLTWIDSDGEILFDSHAEAETMENHANREEIKEALDSGKGSSMRYSATLTEKTIYESIRLSDGTVLRISVSSANIIALIIGMIQPIGFVAIIAIVLSLWLANRMAKHIVKPLNELDLDDPLSNESYEELSPLLCRIHEQRQEIKSQMNKLKKKQEEFDQITENMKEALVLLDHTGRIISINPSAQRLFHTNTHCIGEDFMIVHRKQNMRNALEEAKKQGDFSFQSNLNGKVYRFDLSCIKSENYMQGIVILAYDVTDQVNAEQNRREFTANVSHELKTPLQSIIGSAELIENGIVKKEDLPRFVAHIRKEASRLVSLIEDIIRLSQLDAKLEMEQEEISLYELSKDVSEVLADAARMKGVSIEVSGDKGVITGVRSLLYEAIYNLCDNAIKYNKPGGYIKVSISQHNNEIHLKVQDNGIGIAPEHLEKVFERFYRVDKSHSKQSGGTGLGLSIVKHVALLHQAEIQVESRVGEGTKMIIIF